MDSGRKLRRGIPVDPAFFAPEFMLFHLGLETRWRQSSKSPHVFGLGRRSRSNYLHRFANSSRDQLPNRSMRVAFLECSTTLFDETFFLKHRHSSFL